MTAGGIRSGASSTRTRSKGHARRDWAPTSEIVGNIPSDSDGLCRYFAASGPRQLLSGRRPVYYFIMGDGKLPSLVPPQPPNDPLTSLYRGVS